MKDTNIRKIVLRLLIIPVFLAAVLPAGAADKKLSAPLEPPVELYPKQAPTQKTIGVLIYPGFELLDAYGPMEMWGNLRLIPASVWGGEEHRVSVRVVTIAARRGEVPSNQGPKTVADFGYGDAPQLDYLLVPGGLGAIALLQDRETLNWLRERAG
jgi:transcriptional regulator GlxA family with amidase domain